MLWDCVRQPYVCAGWRTAVSVRHPCGGQCSGNHQHIADIAVLERPVDIAVSAYLLQRWQIGRAHV